MIDIPDIPPLDAALGARLRAVIDGLAKPPGALGRIEDIAVRIGAIQGVMTPRAARALLMVFAGDHGLTAEGVSRYPAEVTAAMVETFLAGRASANAFARAVNAEMRVIDAGIARACPPSPNFVDVAVRRGTGNALHEPALSAAETDVALRRGIALAEGAAAEGFDILAMGEMGIGNTAAAALIMHALTGIPLDQCVGRGAGQDDAGLARKLSVLTRAARRAARRAAPKDPLAVLAEFGGGEIAMMTGAILGAAAARRIVLIDGFISSAAALAASRLAPACLDYCFYAHRSDESGHGRMLQAMNAEPLLDLGLRLGEGTGALLAVPMVRAAARLFTDVASLADVLGAAHDA